MGDFVDTPFRHLSSGMKTRVAFSLITSLDEPTVIIDETLSVGDRSFKRKAYERLDTMLAGGKTLFLVSHSERQLQRLCTRGIYLRRGKVQLDGDIGDVIARYTEDRESGGSSRAGKANARRLGVSGDSAVVKPSAWRLRDCCPPTQKTSTKKEKTSRMRQRPGRRRRDPGVRVAQPGTSQMLSLACLMPVDRLAS